MKIEKSKVGDILILETPIGLRKIIVSNDGLVVQAENWPSIFVPMEKKELEALKDLITNALE